MPCAIMDIGALGEGGESGLIPTPNEAAQMRQRHAARVQRPYGQSPEAIRPDTEDTDTLALATDTLAHTRRRGCTNEATQHGVEAAQMRLRN